MVPLLQFARSQYARLRAPLQRLQARPSFGCAVFVLSAAVFFFALHLAWLASSNPLEIEVREGSSWLHVLAKRAGVDIYDTTRVAFVNMNHGPLDPILKTWISRALPELPGHMVTRTFVLLMPVFFLATAFVISRRHLSGALLAAGALYLLFCNVSTVAFIGRSDATAVCGLVVCGALAHRLLVTRHRNWSNRRYITTQVALGAAAAAVFLTNWRYLPVVAALQFIVVCTQLGGHIHHPPERSLFLRLLVRLGTAMKHLAISTALFLVGFAAVWLAVFLFELHGDIRSYYRHFFGFFLGASGWGTFAGARFNILPPELLLNRRPEMHFLGALILGGLVRLRKQRVELVAWLVILSGVWLAVAYGYFKNQGGGGLQYFYAFFALAWIFVLHAFSRRGRWGNLAQLALVGVVVLTLPVGPLLDQQTLLDETRVHARDFRKEVARMTMGQILFSEESHLFEYRYQGELVDTGDTNQAIARTGYFGEAFNRTFEKYTRQLVANPPKFVIAGLLEEGSPRILSAPLQQLLSQRYTLRLTARNSSFANPGSQALYERND
jgi:hypothetical protein